MRRLGAVPCQVHVLVCANRRQPGGLPWCGDKGSDIFAALKAHVLGRGMARRVWVTETRCLGYCHQGGATVAIYQRGEPSIFYQAVSPGEVEDLIDQHLGG